MSRALSIALVAAVAAVGFGAGLVVFADGSPDPDPSPSPAAVASPAAPRHRTGTAGRPDCPRGAEPDAALAVEVTSEPDPPVPQGTVFTLRPTRDGRPVVGATVCLTADMPDMAHQGARGRASEVSPGVYEVGLDFVMRGGWEGRITVVEPDGPAAAVEWGVTVR